MTKIKIVLRYALYALSICVVMGAHERIATN
jgi:hypothetical protein